MSLLAAQLPCVQGNAEDDLTPESLAATAKRVHALIRAEAAVPSIFLLIKHFVNEIFKTFQKHKILYYNKFGR